MTSDGIEPRSIAGRYALHGELASGGMATVHLGRLLGQVGFSRTVAIKRLHEQYAKDPQFVAMFLDEARLAARVRHQNVVAVLDVVATDGELFLVMDYIHGESVSRLLSTLAADGKRVPPEIACAIAMNMLEGLHAAHDAKNEKGEPLDIVHRDVSPQNVLVGTDGVARVFDFGVAKAAGRMQTTQDGSLKGKMAYMSPEQLMNEPVDRRTDIWAVAVVLWEMLAGRRLFFADSAGALVHTILTTEVAAPSTIAGSPKELDEVLRKGLAREKKWRYATAREMAIALENVLRPASPRAIGDWLEVTAGDALRARAKRVEEMESSTGIQRPVHGSVRTQLEALGFESSPEVTRPTSPIVEEPTAAPQGRVVQRAAEPSNPAVGDLIPSAQFNAQSVAGVGATQHPPPRRPAPWLWAAFALGIATALVAGVVVVRSRAPRAEPAMGRGAEIGGVPAASAAQIVTASAAPAIVASGAASSRRSDDPPASSLAVRPTAPNTVSSHVTAGPRTPLKAPPQRPSSAPRADCDPPYTIGPPPDFIKKPKLECLPQ